MKILKSDDNTPHAVPFPRFGPHMNKPLIPSSYFDVLQLLPTWRCVGNPKNKKTMNTLEPGRGVSLHNKMKVPFKARSIDPTSESGVPNNPLEKINRMLH